MRSAIPVVIFEMRVNVVPGSRLDPPTALRVSLGTFDSKSARHRNKLLVPPDTREVALELFFNQMTKVTDPRPKNPEVVGRGWFDSCLHHVVDQYGHGLTVISEQKFAKSAVLTVDTRNRRRQRIHVKADNLYECLYALYVAFKDVKVVTKK